MSKRTRPDPKGQALRQEGTLHPHPERVRDPLFATNDFFDPRDLVQVKYEMLRRVRIEGQSLAQASRAFGCSRPSFYKARAAFAAGGLGGLIPRRRGPRQPHKLTPEVLAFITQVVAEDPSLKARALRALIERRFALQVHPRTIERALARRQKKRS
jgi:transposase